MTKSKIQILGVKLPFDESVIYEKEIQETSLEKQVEYLLQVNRVNVEVWAAKEKEYREQIKRLTEYNIFIDKAAIRIRKQVLKAFDIETRD